jgi:Phage integrase, N-terminal SAM-like domain
MQRSQCFAERRGNAWRGRYPDADGRMRSTSGHPTKAKALKAARNARSKIEADISAGTTAEPSASLPAADLTLAEWFNHIWPTWDIELTTRANYSAPIRRFILPTFGTRPLKSITRAEIDRWERELIEIRGYSTEYITGARRRLHTILGDAVLAGHLTVNPAARQRGRGRRANQDRARVSAEKVWAAEDTALFVAERCALLGGSPEFVRVLLMAFTGLRWGEVTGLQASYTRALTGAVTITTSASNGSSQS